MKFSRGQKKKVFKTVFFCPLAGANLDDGPG
jgi:hypothetical protein